MTSSPSSSFDARRPTAPFREVRFAPVDIDVETRADSCVLIRNRLRPTAPPVRQLGEYLRRHARERGDAAFLIERLGDDWRTLTYGEALQQANALSQWLLQHGADRHRPVLVLSENSVHHALLQLAAMQIGVPVLSVSPAYSLMSPSGGRIADLARRFGPSVAYAADAARFRHTLALAQAEGATTVSDAPGEGIDHPFAELLATAATAAVDKAFAKVAPETVGRLLLTSGSTSAPKAVQVTHGNMIASGTQWEQCWPFLAERPPVLVDWLPWNHTAGANGSFNMVLRHGGTLVIDDGKPVPELIDRTVANLKRFRPTVMVNVPRGLEMLAARMEDDPTLAEALFPALDVIVYGGASLAPETWLKLETLSAAVTGRRVPVLSSLGSTETTTLATLTWWPAQTIGSIGLPPPGVEVKLVPQDERLEIRYRGPNITPGYRDEPGANAALFDDEGYLRSGDAVRLANADVPAHGLVYEGRIAENFKLSSGTWVSVATVRGALLSSLHPLLSEVVLTGHDGAALGALLFPNREQLARRGLVDTDEIAAALAEGIRAYNREHPGSSTRIARALVLDAPPSIDGGELTDKGHVNQRAVLRLRADAVRRLHESRGDDGCLLFDHG